MGGGVKICTRYIWDMDSLVAKGGNIAYIYIRTTLISGRQWLGTPACHRDMRSTRSDSLIGWPR